VGLLLHMPKGGHPIEVQSQDVVRFKGSLYYVNEPEPTPKTLLVGPGFLMADDGYAALQQGVVLTFENSVGKSRHCLDDLSLAG